MILRLMK